MATETTLVSLGHLLVSNVLNDRGRKQNQLREAHCLLFEKCGLIILKREAISIRENELRFLNVTCSFQIQLPEIEIENSCFYIRDLGRNS